MLREAIQKISEISAPNFFTEQGGKVYVDKPMMEVAPRQYAKPVALHTLTGLVGFIKNNNDFRETVRYYVQVESPTSVIVYSELDEERKREKIAVCEAVIPEIVLGSWIEQEAFLIQLQKNYVDDCDRAMILQFAGTVKSGSVTEYSDDGVSQKATIKKGVASLAEAKVPSPCRLRPYRTFNEVEQPDSQFIFRMKDNGDGAVYSALYEADGGAWRNQAMQNVQEYLKERLDGNFDVIA